jgi:hypothetical protein
VNIDLVAYNSETKIVTLIEVKGGSKNKKYKETLLRCLLEIETYYRILMPTKKLFFDTLKSDDSGRSIENAGEIKKGIYIPKESQAAEELTEMNEGGRPHLKELFSTFGTQIQDVVVF